MEATRGKRKVRKGIVLSNKMEKTVVVKIQRTIRDPRYGKIVTRNKKVYAHNDAEALNIGDTVTVVETRPMSKLKRWRVVV